MKITRLDTYFLSIPLPQPVRTSTSTISQVSEVIVKLSTDADLVGIGEAHGPFLSRQGPVTLPDTPGLGLELRDDTIEKYGVKIG